MGTCVQYYVLCLINLFIVGAIPSRLYSNAAFGVNNIRLRRQAGYVYDRPSLSFNLPSQTPVGSTSTQATTVDRTSAQQMYYAYPAPTSGSTGNVGYSNAGSTGATSTATAGATGYNYGGATQNTVTGSTSATGGGSANNGYSSSDTTRTTSLMTSGGSTGYNYNSGTQNTASISSAGSTSTVSGSRGYDYQIQNTGLQTVTNSGSTGYSATSSGSNSVISAGVSTKAPEYLPPTNSGGANIGATVSSNTQTDSGTANVMPSDIYLPPAVSVSTPELTPSVTATQTAVQQVSGPTQTYIAPVNAPSSSYLMPSSGPQNLNVQNTQSQVTVTSTGNVQSVPTQDYLPPVITSSGTSGQGSVFTPAAKYLPPVF